MSKTNYTVPIFFIIALICFLLQAPYASAQYFEPDNEGATEVTLYKADTVVIDSMITNDVVLMPHDLAELGKTTSVGIATHYSDYTRIYSIPLSYTFWSKLKFECVVPYIQREITNKWTNTTGSAKGLGDIKLGTAYLYQFSPSLDSITSIAITFPTGDPKKEDEMLIIPLGNGSRSYSFNQSFSYTYSQTPLRFYGSILAVLYETAAIETFSSDKIDRGNVYGALVGFEYTWDTLKGFIRINYIDIQESKQHDTWLSQWVGMNDSLKTSDVIIGALYRIYSVIALKASVSIPVYTKYDEDLTDTPGRKWYVNFSVTSFF